MYIYIYIYMYIYVYVYVVRKEVPAPPFLKHPPLDPACLLFKMFVSPPLFSVPPSFKLF